MQDLRSFFLFVLFLMTTTKVIAQCNDWERLSYYKNANIEDAARDRFGNLYVVVSFHHTDFTIGSHTFPEPPGHVGTVIVKFDKENIFRWAVSPTTNYRIWAHEIEVDSEDNLVVAGLYEGDAWFGCERIRDSAGANNIFVAKYLSDGTPLWAVASSGGSYSDLTAMTLSPNGNIIIISRFVESDFDELTEPNIFLDTLPVITGSTNQVRAGFDSFIGAISTDGKVLWTKGIGGDTAEYDYATDIATDSKNNIIVTGYFSSPVIRFDDHVVHRFNDGGNFFLAKLDAFGKTLWVRETEGENEQRGIGVATDTNDDIFVSGNFSDEATFGSIKLLSVGRDDVFLTKFNPEGTVLMARCFGGSDADTPSHVEIDSHGNCHFGVYHASNPIIVGNLTLYDPKFDGANSFLSTFSNDLSDVLCLNPVTGASGAYLWDVKLDASDNTFVFIDRRDDTDTTFFGPHFVVEDDVRMVMAVLGKNPTTASDESPIVRLPAFPIGKDTTLCRGQKSILAVRPLCNAEYKWSDGSSGTAIEVSEQGEYWVDVVINGHVSRSSVFVKVIEPMEINLNNQVICPGDVVEWAMPSYTEPTEYHWNDGDHSHKKTITEPGSYWVKVQNRCETVSASATIELQAPSIVELGPDLNVCSGKKAVLRYSPSSGETWRWSDGSDSPMLSVGESGTYALTVNNGCEEAKDEIKITFEPGEESTIPNVITINGDGKNDHLILPTGVTSCTLSLFNRWGERIFSSGNYTNDWPTHRVEPGIYFYTLQSNCIREKKGAIHVVE